jgi:O-antigen ligase
MLGVAVGISLLLGALLGSLPAQLLPFFASGVLLTLLAVGVLWKSELLIYFVVLTSALSGLLRAFGNLNVGNTTISVSGLRWGYVVVVMGFVLLADMKRVRIPRHALLLAGLPCWTALTLLTSRSGSIGFKDVLFYSMPLVMLIYSQHTLKVTHGRPAARFERALLGSVLLPIMLYALLIPLGLVVATENGPKGLIGPRAVALYLLIPQVLGLALWRYADNARERLLGAATALLSLMTIVFTLSRGATLIGVLLIGLSRLKRGRKIRSGILTVAGVGLAVGVLMLVPQLRERSFFRSNLAFFGYVESFNTAGRNKMWPLTFQHALERPLVGWGPGSSRLLMGELLVNKNVTDYHPHNEYLQVFHDTGLIGLLFLTGSWGVLLWRQFKQWRQAEQSGKVRASRSSLAALLGVVALMLTALTDNTFHYAFVVLPVMLLVAISEHRARENLSVATVKEGRPTMGASRPLSTEVDRAW